MIITIDGPSGVGKSTVSKSVARILGFVYLDTGAMYRAVALRVKRDEGDIDDDRELKNLLEKTEISFRITKKNELVLMLDGEDVTDKIRTPEISRLSSDVATKSIVRKKLVGLQRELGNIGDIVAEGRDMGTHVFPDAEFKFYLDASLEERTRRRWQQLEQSGNHSELEDVNNELKRRDTQDSERSDSPLYPALDAVIIDTTKLSAEEVTDRIVSIVKV
jgi:cytidylate kinase